MWQEHNAFSQPTASKTGDADWQPRARRFALLSDLGHWMVALLLLLGLLGVGNRAAAQATFTQMTNTTGDFINVDPFISADGTRIAFSSYADLTGSNPDGNWEIFLWTQGIGFTQITNTTGDGNLGLSLSADSTRIAFVSNGDPTGGNADGNNEIFRWTQGGGITQITNTTGGISSNLVVASINADGTRIAFVSDRNLTGGNLDENYEIFLAEIPTRLTILTSTMPLGEAGAAYLVALQAEGGSPPYTWSLVSGRRNKLPQGLTLTAEGTLTGVPTQARTTPFTVQVRDAAGASATRNLSSQIVKGVKLNTRRLKPGKVGTSYSATLQTIGGIPPLTFSLVGGALPTGLTLNPATGQITGTPTAAGAFDFQVRVASSGGSSDQKGMRITVN